MGNSQTKVPSTTELRAAFADLAPIQKTALIDEKQRRHADDSGVADIDDCHSHTASPTTSSTNKESRSSANFRWLEDRPYVDIKGVQYLLPTDAAERDRQDQKYFLYKSVLQGQVYFSPVKDMLKKGCKVLDVGCGSGVWMMELATEHPESKFMGLDIMQSFPSLKPANCTFAVVNVIMGIPFADNTFEFVVIRNMESSFTREQWIQVLNECFRVLQPGGYIELWSLDGMTYKPGVVTKALVERIHLACATRGIDVRLARDFHKLLHEVGFELVEGTFFSMPLYWGPHGKENGQSMTEGYLGLGPVFSLAMNISTEEYDSLVQQASRECGEHKSFWNYYIAYGMKPFPM